MAARVPFGQCSLTFRLTIAQLHWAAVDVRTVIVVSPEKRKLPLLLSAC
jgi:hypothetical protein